MDDYWGYIQKGTIRRRDLLRLAGVGGAALALDSLLPRILAAAATQKKTLTMALDGEPLGLNPIISAGNVPGVVVMTNHIYNTIVRPDPRTGAVIPELAESWRQKDQLTWTFKLRKGVKFHKGFGELTAEDIEFLFNTTIRENKPLRFRFIGVEGAKAVGRYEVEVKLERPFLPFLLITGWRGGSVPSKRAYLEIGETNFNRNPVGSGPFEFASWEPGSRIVFRKHPSYWKKGKPVLEELVFKPIFDPAVRVAQLKTGEVDLVESPDYKDVRALRDTKGIRVFNSGGGNFNYIAFNTKRPPFDRKEVRQAISYAIDRQALVQFVYFGEAIADDVPVPRGYLGKPPRNTYPLSGDPERARELLAKAGLPKGFETTAFTTDRETARRALQIVADQLSRVGIQVNIQFLDLATYNSRLRRGDFDMGLEDINLTTSDTDSAVFAFLISSGSPFNTGYANSTMDELLFAGRAETDPAKRAQIYRRIFEIVLEDAPYVYLLHKTLIYAANEKLMGFVATPNSCCLDNLEAVSFSG